MEKLGILFGSIARVKILRLFLFSPVVGFDIQSITSRTRVSTDSVRKELTLLTKAGFLKKKTVFIEVETRSGTTKKRVPGWYFNEKFEYRQALYNLLVDAEFLTKEEVAHRFKPLGKIKLLLLAGVFIQSEESRADILIVGDLLRRPLIERAIKVLESEIGKELSYVIFETEEFLYRANMYDKLVRDIIDFPHEKVIDQNILVHIPRPQ